jgi:uncharacterized damage-inducible protein DinB
MLSDAFGHHVWATLRLIDACRGLDSERLETAVPGTYGSILDTLRHLVGGDAGYLFYIDGDRTHLIDEDQLGLPELRAVMERHGHWWSAVLNEHRNPDAVLREIDEDDGYIRDAPLGIRLAQALHHGTDHRSQICTALTALEVGPPAIDVWDYGLAVGRVTETYPLS